MIENEFNTAKYYDDHAEAFYQDTVNADMSKIRERFESLMPKGAEVLDLGCGSGRDALAFADKGFCVTMMDPSKEMCERAEKLTGRPCVLARAQELDALEAFDGIWACASLIHVPETETVETYQKIAKALKPGGILFTTYKYGTGEKMRGERFFYDMTEDSLKAIIGQVAELSVMDTWLTGDVRPGRGEERWLNAIVQRVEMEHD